jgi:DNA-binding NtrC family response regulator
VLAEGREIGPRDLPIPNGAEGLEPKPPSGFLGEAIARGLTLRALEDLYIREMLVATGGNKVRAAELLGVHPRTLHRRNPRD